MEHIMTESSKMPDNNRQGTEELFLRNLLRILWRSRKTIVMSTLAVIILSVGISLILPKSFKSTAVILPQNNQSMLGAFSGLSNLASLTGLSFGQSSMEQLFPDIVNSEALLKQVIYTRYKTEKFADSVNLIQYWEIEEDTETENFEEALEKFRKNIIVDYDKRTNIVSITYSIGEIQLVSDVLNKVIALLDEYIRKMKITSATEQRNWIEQRLVQVQNDLASSENALKDFREKNRIISNSPQLLLEQQRMIRDVEINTVIYTELKKQYELARIEELKNIPVVNILDSARPPAKKDKPKRAIIVLVSTMLGFLAACGYVYYRDVYRAGVASFIQSVIRTDDGELV